MKEKKPSERIEEIFKGIYDNKYVQWRNLFDALVTYLDEQYRLGKTILYADPEYLISEINFVLEDLKLGRRSSARRLLLKIKEEVSTRSKLGVS